jgi:phage terminase large subunit GpA-like protein
MKSDAIQRLREALADALKPAPKLLVSEWARANFQLSSEYSATTGLFQAYPYQIEPLDMLGPASLVDMMVLMCGAQMMKTLLMMIFLGYVIDVDPGPMLIVQPTAPDAKTFSKERIAPMVHDNPCLRSKVVEAKSRDSGNTIEQKRFRGGSVTITGAISPRGLRRRSVRYLLLDEVDGYEDTSDGDPISLAAARTGKFWNRKIVLCSTPTIDGRSRIARAFEKSDQRVFFVPCPFCQHPQELAWPGVRWGDVDGMSVEAENAVYQCAECKVLIPHYRKLEMLRGGQWIATNPEGKYPGFRINRLYSPDWSWGQLVTDPLEGWLQAQGNPAALQAFINNVMAQTWREPGEAPPDWEKLRARAVLEDAYKLGTVPAGVLFLTAGVDVQKTWLEGYVCGWGRGKQRWVIDHFRIERTPYDPQAWVELSAQLNRTYRHANGADLSIVRMGVDTRYESNQVYAWARQHGASRVIAVAGRADGNMVAPPTLVDLTIGGRKIKNGCKLWGVNVSICKSELYGQLNIPAPKEPPFPAGWVHFPSDLPEEFYKQVTSEQFILSVVRGQRKYHWEGIAGLRHEALDDLNYARAMASVVGMDRFSEKNWQNLEASLGVTPSPAPVVEVQPQPKPQIMPPVSRLTQPRRIVRSNYLNYRGY